jgi:hypothetical protein
MPSSQRKQLTHLQFQEAVASGLVILAYSHCPGRREDEKLPLDYDPLKALEMLRGLGPRGGSSSAACGSAASAQLTTKRRLPMKTADSDLQAPVLVHELILCSEVGASGDNDDKKYKSNPFCQVQTCWHVADDAKRTKCGKDLPHTLKARSRTQYMCS